MDDDIVSGTREMYCLLRSSESSLPGVSSYPSDLKSSLIKLKEVTDTEQFRDKINACCRALYSTRLRCLKNGYNEAVSCGNRQFATIFRQEIIDFNKYCHTIQPLSHSKVNKFPFVESLLNGNSFEAPSSSKLIFNDFRLCDTKKTGSSMWSCDKEVCNGSTFEPASSSVIRNENLEDYPRTSKHYTFDKKTASVKNILDVSNSYSKTNRSFEDEDLMALQRNKDLKSQDERAIKSAAPSKNVPKFAVYSDKSYKGSKEKSGCVKSTLSKENDRILNLKLGGKISDNNDHKKCVPPVHDSNAKFQEKQPLLALVKQTHVVKKMDLHNPCSSMKPLQGSSKTTSNYLNHSCKRSEYSNESKAKPFASMKQRLKGTSQMLQESDSKLGKNKKVNESDIDVITPTKKNSELTINKNSEHYTRSKRKQSSFDTSYVYSTVRCKAKRLKSVVSSPEERSCKESQQQRKETVERNTLNFTCTTDVSSPYTETPKSTMRIRKDKTRYLYRRTLFLSPRNSSRQKCTK